MHLGSGLDLEGLTPRLRRTHTTVITAAVAIVLPYVGVFVFDAVESVTAMTIALNAVTTPWIAILAIGALRTPSYDAVDPQAFRARLPRRSVLVHRRLARRCGDGVVGGRCVRLAGHQHHPVRRAAGRRRGRRRPEHDRIGRDRGLDLCGVTALHRRMTNAEDADALVTEFCALWSRPDLDAIVGYFTEDAVYHNIPMPPAEGREAIREFIAGFMAAFDGIDFTVHRQIAQGDARSCTVMNERTDVMRRQDGLEIELPVMGVFEVRDGRIAAWRDYFDMGMVTAAFE